MLGKYGTEYEFGPGYCQVKATKPDGKVFYIPFDDMIMMVADYKRRMINAMTDAEVVGLGK